MNLRQGLSNGRVYLSIVHGYRDPVTKKVKQKTIKSLGYLEDLEKIYGDPVAHFKQVVKEMNEERLLENQPVSLNIDPKEILKDSSENRKNIGYAALSQIYHDLGLHVFFSNSSRSFKAKFNTNNIMKLLIYSRVLNPASKKKTYEEKGRYFENTDFSLDDLYRCLSQVITFKERLQKHLHRKIEEKYGRTTELVYYDVILPR
ncbi:MAG: hypothetical protein GX878_04135 [Firmicutes bacterium]|nr:hypothetical protein [Bacillota bacterium]